jgi:hypothetical protein
MADFFSSAAGALRLGSSLGASRRARETHERNIAQEDFLARRGTYMRALYDDNGNPMTAEQIAADPNAMRALEAMHQDPYIRDTLFNGRDILGAVPVADDKFTYAVRGDDGKPAPLTARASSDEDDPVVVHDYNSLNQYADALRYVLTADGENLQRGLSMAYGTLRGGVAAAGQQQEQQPETSQTADARLGSAAAFAAPDYAPPRFEETGAPAGDAPSKTSPFGDPSDRVPATHDAAAVDTDLLGKAARALELGASPIDVYAATRERVVVLDGKPVLMSSLSAADRERARQETASQQMKKQFSDLTQRLKMVPAPERSSEDAIRAAFGDEAIGRPSRDPKYGPGYTVGDPAVEVKADVPVGGEFSVDLNKLVAESSPRETEAVVQQIASTEPSGDTRVNAPAVNRLSRPTTELSQKDMARGYGYLVSAGLLTPAQAVSAYQTRVNDAQRLAVESAKARAQIEKYTREAEKHALDTMSKRLDVYGKHKDELAQVALGAMQVAGWTQGTDKNGVPTDAWRTPAGFTVNFNQENLIDGAIDYIREFDATLGTRLSQVREDPTRRLSNSDLNRIKQAMTVYFAKTGNARPSTDGMLGGEPNINNFGRVHYSPGTAYQTEDGRVVSREALIRGYSQQYGVPVNQINDSVIQQLVRDNRLRPVE